MLNTKNKNKSQAYKVRRSGNSDIITIPSFVKERLSIDVGDTISFVEIDGTIRVEKEEQKIDIDKIVDQALNQYHDLLTELVDL